MISFGANKIMNIQINGWMSSLGRKSRTEWLTRSIKLIRPRKSTLGSCSVFLNKLVKFTNFDAVLTEESLPWPLMKELNPLGNGYEVRALISVTCLLLIGNAKVWNTSDELKSRGHSSLMLPQ